MEETEEPVKGADMVGDCPLQITAAIFAEDDGGGYEEEDDLETLSILDSKQKGTERCTLDSE